MTGVDVISSDPPVVDRVPARAVDTAESVNNYTCLRGKRESSRTNWVWGEEHCTHNSVSTSWLDLPVYDRFALIHTKPGVTELML